jgi:RNA polymerase sigma-70 factor (ECF subfamily)
MKFLELLFSNKRHQKQIDSYEKQTDDWLIERWIDSEDEKAYEEICNRYAQRIFNFVYSRIRNESASMDVVQHCLLEFTKNPETFKNKDDLAKYFFKISSNYFGKEQVKNLNVVSFEEKREQGFDLPDKNTNIEIEFLAQERDSLLVKFISELKEDHRDVCYLYFYEQCKPSEIAEILKIPVKKVKNIILYNQPYIQKRFLETYTGNL